MDPVAIYVIDRNSVHYRPEHFISSPECSCRFNAACDGLIHLYFFTLQFTPAGTWKTIENNPQNQSLLELQQQIAKFP